MECTNQHILMGMVTLKRDCEPMEKEKGKKKSMEELISRFLYKLQVIMVVLETFSNHFQYPNNGIFKYSII